MMKNILIVAQVIPQWYVDLLTKALGEDTKIHLITGSTVALREEDSVSIAPIYRAESLKSRLLSWFKFDRFVSRFTRKNKKKSYDLIFAISNPPFNARRGVKLKKVYHAPFVYMNWDLYPQIIRESMPGVFVRAVCRLWSRKNNKNFPKIDKMLTIGDVMAKSLVKDLHPKAQGKVNIQVLPIAVDTERLKPLAKSDNPFLKEVNIKDKFIVLYSGKMGRGHNIELVLETATLLESAEDIVFVFVGEGSKYPLVEAYIKEHNAQNILLFPMQSEEMFPCSMACGDLGLVTQEDRLAHLFMPSKAYSYMACGLPVLGICTKEDDLYQTVETQQAGVCLTDGKKETLKDIILTLQKDSEQRQMLADNARKTAVEVFDKNVLCSAYREIFTALLQEDNLAEDSER